MTLHKSTPHFLRLLVNAFRPGFTVIVNKCPNNDSPRGSRSLLYSCPKIFIKTTGVVGLSRGWRKIPGNGKRKSSTRDYFLRIDGSEATVGAKVLLRGSLIILLFDKPGIGGHCSTLLLLFPTRGILHRRALQAGGNI